MRPDGGDIRWHALICGDNPTGLAIAPTGELFGTCNLYNGVPRYDTIGQWQLGGIYTRPDFLHIVADQLRTHLQMPLVANLGHLVPSGCALWSRGPELAPALAAASPAALRAARRFLETATAATPATNAATAATTMPATAPDDSFFEEDEEEVFDSGLPATGSHSAASTSGGLPPDAVIAPSALTPSDSGSPTGPTLTGSVLTGSWGWLEHSGGTEP